MCHNKKRQLTPKNEKVSRPQSFGHTCFKFYGFNTVQLYDKNIEFHCRYVVRVCSQVLLVI